MLRFDVAIDCVDIDAQGRFWAAALGYEYFGAVVGAGEAGQYRSIVPPDGEVAPKIVLQHVPEPKQGKTRLHLDLMSGAVEAEAARLIGLGATRARDEIFEEHGHRWIAMLDPEGNEFCICEGNDFC